MVGVDALRETPLWEGARTDLWLMKRKGTGRDEEIAGTASRKKGREEKKDMRSTVNMVIIYPNYSLFS